MIFVFVFFKSFYFIFLIVLPVAMDCIKSHVFSVNHCKNKKYVCAVTHIFLTKYGYLTDWSLGILKQIAFQISLLFFFWRYMVCFCLYVPKKKKEITFAITLYKQTSHAIICFYFLFFIFYFFIFFVMSCLSLLCMSVWICNKIKQKIKWEI